MEIIGSELTSVNILFSDSERKFPTLAVSAKEAGVLHYEYR
jgi:hypothetical protein